MKFGNSKKNPLVSIGMPTYNRSFFIRESLDSLLNQTYRNFELIISDNASTDNTEAICKEYARIDKRIKYIRQEKNIGPLNNFSFVLKEARGEYFMWASDDDNWYKNFIKTLLTFLIKKDDCVVAICDYIYFGDLTKVKKKLKTKNNMLRSERIIDFLDNYQETLAPLFYGLFKRRVLLEIGGVHEDSRPYYKAGDSVTMFKVLLLGDFIHVKKILFKKRDTSGFLFNDYKTLRDLNFSPPVIFRIKRYLYTPVIILFDFYYLIKFTFKSDLKFPEKLLVSIYCVKRLVKSYMQFVSKIIKGIYYVISGLFKKYVSKLSVF